MKLIAQVKLKPTKEQAKLLKSTLEQANTACNAISELVWNSQTFGQYAIHQAYYAQIRTQFGLSAQVVVRCIAKVADAYKLDKEQQRRFKPLGAIAYDDRILTWRTDKQFVNIWTVGERQKIPYVCGEKQKKLLEFRQGESDLVHRKGDFFLLAVCEVPEPTPEEIDDALGVDFGIVNLATDSDGQSYSGEKIEAHRQRQNQRRKALQQVGTRSAHRKLKKISGKQRRYQSHQNHIISKRLVNAAQRTKRGIAIEDLKGITSRTRVKQSQRNRHTNWAFSQLRAFVEYKAKAAGVTVIAVNAKYTSETCSQCGHRSKANRKSQFEFVCQSCHYSTNADYNAALNIRFRAVSSQPMVAERMATRSLPSTATSRHPLGCGS
jgi:IS605 OrfB family transposase